MPPSLLPSPIRQLWLPATLAALAAATAAASGNLQLFLWINERSRILSPAVWSGLNLLGTPQLMFILLAFLWWRWRRASIAAAGWCALVICGATTHLLKHAASWPRPASLLSPEQFHLIGPALKGAGFPSGHATTAFAFAAIALAAAPNPRRAALPALLLAMLAALSRIAIGVHTPLDVIVGALVGWLGGLVALKLCVHSRLWRRAAVQQAMALGVLGCALWLWFDDFGYPLAAGVRRALAGGGLVLGLSLMLRAVRRARAGEKRPGALVARVLVAASITIPVIGWMTRELDWSNFAKRLASLPTVVLLVAVLGLLASYVFRALRVHAELAAEFPLTRLTSLRLTLWHNAMVNILPLRSGEAAFPWLLQREAGVPLSRSLASLLWLRLQDLAVVAALALSVWPGLHALSRALLGVLMGGLIVLAVRWLRRLPATPAGRMGPLLAAWRRATGAPTTWFWCALNWLTKLSAQTLLLAALLDIGPAAAAIGIFGAEAAAISPIQGLAGFGSYEAGAALSLGIAHVPLADALAAALTLHLFNIACAGGSALLAWPLRRRPAAVRPPEPAHERATPPALPAHHLSLVVPLFNEVGNVEPLLRRIHAALADYPQPWELILVDDGSTDGTARLARQAAGRYGAHVRVLELTRNFKQTAAMQAGIDIARGDVVVTLDGDLQNDPYDIRRLVGRLLDEELDLVAGWRKQREDGALRRLPSLVANRLIAAATGVHLHDYGCTLKAFRAEILRQIRLYGEMHRFIPTWLMTVTSPARVAEEPVAHHARVAGESKYGLWRTFRVLLDLVVVLFFMRFRARPGHFFGYVGLALCALATVALLHLGYVKFWLGEPIGGRPLLFVALGAEIAGLQFIMTGVLAEFLTRIYFGSGAARPYHVRSGTTNAAECVWQEAKR